MAGEPTPLRAQPSRYRKNRLEGKAQEKVPLAVQLAPVRGGALLDNPGQSPYHEPRHIPHYKERPDLSRTQSANAPSGLSSSQDQLRTLRSQGALGANYNESRNHPATPTPVFVAQQFSVLPDPPPLAIAPRSAYPEQQHPAYVSRTILQDSIGMALTDQEQHAEPQLQLQTIATPDSHVSQESQAMSQTTTDPVEEASQQDYSGESSPDMQNQATMEDERLQRLKLKEAWAEDDRLKEEKERQDRAKKQRALTEMLLTGGRSEGSSSGDGTPKKSRYRTMGKKTGDQGGQAQPRHVPNVQYAKPVPTTDTKPPHTTQGIPQSHPRDVRQRTNHHTPQTAHKPEPPLFTGSSVRPTMKNEYRPQTAHRPDPTSIPGTTTRPALPNEYRPQTANQPTPRSLQASTARPALPNEYRPQTAHQPTPRSLQASTTRPALPNEYRPRTAHRPDPAVAPVSNTRPAVPNDYRPPTSHRPQTASTRTPRAPIMNTEVPVPRPKDGYLPVVDQRPQTAHRPQTASARAPDWGPPLANTINPNVSGGEKPKVIDAPNPNAHMVRIKVGNQSTFLAVNATTTPLQLICAAPTLISVPIDTRNSVLYEDFTKCNILRPLRMYELVREVLDSWDKDDQHCLILQPSDPNIPSDKNLYPSFAPKESPKGKTWTLVISRKRGKWDKNEVTLHDDGTLTVRKGKQTKNVGDLRVSDIYTINPLGHGYVAPPKKFCFAVKSMMKVNMFEGDEGYITYFSTDNAQDSSDFYDTVHSWRSYYLRVVKGQGSPTEETAHAQLLNSTDPSLRGAHIRNPSSDNAFLSKSFKPELDLDFDSFEVREESKKKNYRNSNLPLASTIIVPLNSHGIPSAAEHSAALHARQNNIRQGVGTSAPPQSHTTLALRLDPEPIPMPAAQANLTRVHQPRTKLRNVPHLSAPPRRTPLPCIMSSTAAKGSYRRPMLVDL